MALLAEMKSTADLDVDARSVHFAISSCGKNGDWQRGQILLEQMQRWKIEANIHCHTALLSSFQKSKAWEMGLRHLKLNIDVEKFDAIAFETALKLSSSGAWEDAIWLFHRKKLQQLPPSITSLVSLVKSIQSSSRGVPKQSTLLEELYMQIEQGSLSLLKKVNLHFEDLQISTDSIPDVIDGKALRSEIVQLVSAMDLLFQDEELNMREELTVTFDKVIFRPVLKALEASNVQLLEFVHGLGVFFTEKALQELKMDAKDSTGETAAWVSEASDAVSAALKGGTCDEITGEFFEKLEASASARHLMSWISYLLRVQENPARFLRSNGKIVAHGRDDHSSATSESLAAVFSDFDRSQHSERRALLKLLQRLEERSDVSEVSGSVRLFSCHTPCVSCLFVFTQFRAMYPKIRFSVAFKSWAQSYRQKGKGDSSHSTGLWDASNSCDLEISKLLDFEKERNPGDPSTFKFCFFHFFGNWEAV